MFCYVYVLYVSVWFAKFMFCYVSVVVCYVSRGRVRNEEDAINQHPR